MTMKKNNKKQGLAKDKIIVLIVLAVIIIGGGIGVVSMFSDDVPDDEMSEMDIPGDSEVSYDSKLGVMEKGEEKDKENANDMSINLNFDDLSFDEKPTTTTQKEEVIEEPVKASTTSSSKSNTYSTSGTSKPKTTNYKPKSTTTTKTSTTSATITTKSNLAVQNTRSGFYTAETAAPSSSKESALNVTSIKAIIHGTQNVVNGSLVKIRLMQDAFVNNVRYSSGDIIYGTANFQNNRVNIVLSSQGFTNSSVNDAKGGKGIIVEGGINQEIAQDGAGTALQKGGTKINTPIGSFSTDALKKKNQEVSYVLNDHYNIVIKP